ncbi:uncharacterized protein LOC131219146 isoform X2 [Magnolia sinica]|uniref:uncharacterized protein LOC131219146 isoform X2 n=1 Tax=Magnolia sinica TaxID=86752 RepID=UPI0026596131|nr:uncharacterized protein LOC131219146 isoform X2 [Magnolia sinica]
MERWDEGLEWEEVEPPQCQSHVNKEWEMMGGDDCSIFPPSSHEGLPISNTLDVGGAPPAAEPPPSVVIDRGRDIGELPVQPTSRPSTFTLLRFSKHQFHLIRSKLLLILRPLTPCPVWSFAPAAITLLGALIYRCRRRALSMDKESSMLLLIRDKDEKISQLMHQITEMNKVVSARRSVPVLRSA